MNVIVIIPARRASTRFPNKMLATLAGRPLIVHALDHARQASTVAGVWVATDCPEIAAVVEDAGGCALMTPAELPSGTDRIACAFEALPDEVKACDYVINIQGDEPLFGPQDLNEFVRALSGDPMATLARPMDASEDPRDPNRVKVVMDRSGRALYFSRSPVPFDRDHPADKPLSGIGYWHHLGVYAYRPETLRCFVSLPPGELEMKEKLEQLRALENGIAIQVIPTRTRGVGVDTLEDLRRVESLMGSCAPTPPGMGQH